MTRDFEIWPGAYKHLKNVDAAGLLEDSLRCYKNDIDRPAYFLPNTPNKSWQPLMDKNCRFVEV